VSYDGTNFLAAWTDRRSGSGYDIYGARVTPAGVVLDPSGIPISTATDWQEYPVLAFDGASFLVVWLDWRNGSSDIYGSRVTPGGVVFDSGPVVRQEGIQESPALARGSGSQLFLVYQGWASSVGGKTYNNDRIWGKLNPSPAVAEMTKPEVRMTNGRATIVRGVLVLGAVDSRQNTAYRTELLDISGRKVLDLKPGANDVRAIVPGVYFVREAHQAAGLKPQAVRKIVIAR
jgi:hypothetical protein